MADFKVLDEIGEAIPRSAAVAWRRKATINRTLNG